MLYFAERLSPHMAESAEGYLICRGVPVARSMQMIYVQLFVLIPGLPNWILLITPVLFIGLVCTGYLYAAKRYVSMHKALEAHEKKRNAKVLRRKKKRKKRPEGT